MPDTEVAITELLEIDPERVDAVSSPANGTEWLILKATDGSETVTDAAGVLAEIEKADDDDKRPDCPTCKGKGKIMDGHRTCPDCKGSGVKPQPGDTEKSLLELAAAKAGAAASGADVPVPDDCVHCKGSGKDGTGTCDACAGSGKTADTPPASELNTVDADGGHMTEGAGGRETVDKAAETLRIDGAMLASAVQEFTDKLDAAKATISTADQNDLPDSDFAYIEPGGKMDKSGKTTPRSLRHFPIMDAAHVRNALARAPQSPFGDKAMPAIKAAAKKFDIEVSDASKASGDVFTAPNPALADAASQVVGDPAPDTGGSTDGPMSPPATPGSPAWEAVDAQTATDAALALMTAVELMRTFAQRESTEVAMGEGNDVFDAYAASEAICAAQAALGVMAQLAFHEGLEAAKSLPDDESVEKAGRRLAGKTVAALAAARDKAKDLADHIGGVLGDDDPKKQSASKSADEIDMDALSKELENMSTDELTKVLDARDEKLVGLLAEALKSAPKSDTKKSKKDKTEDAPAEAAKAEGEDAEVVAEVETDGETAAEPAEETAKAELTPEEIEANEAAAAAKKEAKRLKKAAEQTAADAATAKAIEEAVTKATAAVDSLKDELAAAKQATDDRLATVEKMAAPSNIVRTAPTEAQTVAKARDEKEIRIATLEREARETTDHDIRKARREEARELRESLAAS